MTGARGDEKRHRGEHRGGTDQSLEHSQPTDPVSRALSAHRASI
jgi:hypothetical protein